MPEDDVIDGGMAASHPPPELFEIRAAPSSPSAKAVNTIRETLVAVACWRLEDVRFDFDSSILLPGARKEFKKLAQIRAAHPGSPMTLFGHADPVGNDAYNKELSGRRATCVYALLTRDVALWERLYTTTVQGVGDPWKYKAIQVMLKALGHDPGPITGTLNAATQTAVKSFQRANTLTDDGDPGPNTRAKLFPQYMDFVAVNEANTPFQLAKTDFLARGADPGGKGDYQGCSEFNPVLMFSDTENKAFQNPSRKAERDSENAPNRRVLALLFRPTDVVAPAKWPCPRVSEGSAACQSRFFSDAATRRQFQANRRKFAETKDTFACRFYQRFVEKSPCEGVPAGPVNNVVSPVLSPANVIVTVKKPHTTPKRKPVRLSTSAAFGGTGKLTRSSDAIRFFTALTGGTEILFNDTDNVFTGAQLSAGVTLHAEGATPSARMNDFSLTLTLEGSPVGLPAVTTMTSVELTLEVSPTRTTLGTDPAPLSATDKINPGRFIHRQFGDKHGRAMLTVRQAIPADFTGSLTVTPITAGVRLFAAELPTAGEAALSNPHIVANSAIPAAQGLRLFAEGVTTSAALRDTGFRLGIQGDETDGDHVAITVVQLSNLKATVPTTPPNTNRAPAFANAVSPATVDFIRGATPVEADYDSDFTQNNMLVLIENSILAAKPIQLSVTVAPAGAPVLWSVRRDTRAGAAAAANVGDAPAILTLTPAPAATPTLAPVAAAPLTATLLADSVGSFHLCAYVDGNGNNVHDFNDTATGARIDREPFIVMPLVLVRVQGHTNLSQAHAHPGFNVFSGGRPAPDTPFAPGAPTAATGLRLVSGSFAGPANAAAHNIGTVTVVGGGRDGKRGLDEVFGGWVNNESNVEDVVATYTDPANGRVHSRISVVVSNVPAGGTFVPGGTAPAVIPHPFLDTTNFGNEGRGGNTCVGTEGRIGPPAPQTPAAAGSTVANNISRVDLPIAVNAVPVGQQWQIEMWDSPGDSCPPTHGSFPGVLTSYRFNIDFRCDMVFWTNISRVIGPTADPACRLYASVWSNLWNIRYAISFPPPAPLPTLTANMTPDTRVAPLAAAVDGSGLEVRFPILLRQLATDAQN